MPIEQPRTIWTPAATPRAVLLLGHGAGSPMTTPFLGAFATAIAELGVSVLRFDFPYMEAGRKAPDRAPVLVEATRRAFNLAVARADGRPVLAGGRSMGGRIASMATAGGMPAFMNKWLRKDQDRAAGAGISGRRPGGRGGSDERYEQANRGGGNE